jgi:hypothetical protein
MSDNITATELAGFASWGIPLLSAIGGAAVVLVGREFIEWIKSPRLKIDFENWIDARPRIRDFSFGEKVLGIEHKGRRLRLKVYNMGKKPALNCEAKVVVTLIEDKDTGVQTLHWTRRDPKLYETLERIYAPIHLNSRDNESLDVLELTYDVDKDKQRLTDLSPDACIETISPYSIMLERNKTYQLEITVYANNAISKPFRFQVNWDGTVEGFNTAFNKN